MEATEVIRILSKHPVVTLDMAMEVQLGLPYLEKRNDTLCISFKPHRQLPEDGILAFYSPQYTLTWAYPFHRLVNFRNLYFFEDIALEKPVCQLELQEYARRGSYYIAELFKECSWVMSEMEQYGTVSDTAVRSYQKSFYETVCKLGLEAVYGKEWL